MKILVFCDVHARKKYVDLLIKKSKNVDLLICAGDSSWFGYGLEDVFSSLKKTGKKMLVIPGTHESENDVKKLVKKYNYLIDFHGKCVNIGGLNFIGYGNLGFKKVESDFEKLIPKLRNEIKDGDKVVFVTHGPAYGCKLDKLPITGYVGCKSFNKFINEIKPIYHFCGHIHENFGVNDRIGKTILINPGPAGKILEIKKKK